LPSCVVEARSNADAAPAPRVSCNTDMRAPEEGQDPSLPAQFAFAPVIETLEEPAGVRVRVTY
jgi:hypothetical protein